MFLRLGLNILILTFRYVHHLLDGPIKKMDYKTVVKAVSATPLGVEVLYEFLENNLNDTLKTNDGESTVTTIYSVLVSKVATRFDIGKVSVDVYCLHI